jgi:hypothetical protein
MSTLKKLNQTTQELRAQGADGLAAAIERAAYTPGAWDVRFMASTDTWAVTTPPGSKYEDCDEQGRRHLASVRAGREAEANARLIAAAPDLLSACRDTLDALYHAEGDVIEEIREQLRAAIAKAEGRK